MGFDNLEFMDLNVMEGFLFEERNLLEMNKDSHKIKKPLSSSPAVQYTRRPVIIHTYSPKIIQTEAHNFMQLVQKLTGWDRQHKGNKRKKNKTKKIIGNENSDTTFPDTTTSPCQWKKLELNAAKANSIEMWKNNTQGSKNFDNHNLAESTHINLRNEAPVMNQDVKEVSSSGTPDYAADMNSNTVNITMDLTPSLDGASHHNSSQSFYYPCKRGTSMDISQNFYDNPCQEPFRFVEALGCSSPTPIADSVYNISELLPQFFTRDFEYQHLL